MAFEWTTNDQQAVDTARVLAADAVEKVGNGHPGTAMSLAPVAHLLFQKVMDRDPADDQWMGRDRFILSVGHSSLTQYIQLYLTGSGLEKSDLESLRTWGSLTPMPATRRSMMSRAVPSCSAVTSSSPWDCAWSVTRRPPSRSSPRTVRNSVPRTLFGSHEMPLTRCEAIC